MNTPPVVLLFLAILAVASPASHAAPVPTGDFKSFILPLRPGASPADARQALGAPHATLGPELWIYWDFGAPNPNVVNPAFDTLVVAFANDRVVAVKVTDGRVVRQLLADAVCTTKGSAVASASARR